MIIEYVGMHRKALNPCKKYQFFYHLGKCSNYNNIFISYIKYTNITPPANSKANRGRWCSELFEYMNKKQIPMQE